MADNEWKEQAEAHIAELQAQIARLTTKAGNSDIANAIRDAMAAVHPNAVETGETSGPPSSRPSTLRTEIPIFSGTYLEDVNSWLSLVEDALTLYHLPNEEYTASAASYLRNKVILWYVQARMDNDDIAPHWHVFKQALLTKYNSDLRIDEIRSRLSTLRFTNRDLNRYITDFCALALQLNNTQMAFGDKMSYLSNPLPLDLVRH